MDELINKITTLPEKYQKQVAQFVDSLILKTDDKTQIAEEPVVEYQKMTKKETLPDITPADFQSELYELTGRKEPNEAFRKLVQWYLRAELFRLEFQKKEYEEKWNMTFEEFAEKNMQADKPHSYEIEEIYCDWEGVVFSLDRKLKLQRKWM